MRNNIDNYVNNLVSDIKNKNFDGSEEEVILKQILYFDDYVKNNIDYGFDAVTYNINHPYDKNPYGKAFTEEGDEQFSPLIRRAVQLVRKYYDQGVTLEETAERLFVSEEYLSSQFKKETGAGFTETVRHYRIERIKGLLLNTRLKLNQIAELTGYTDPKYMSRVFKEEVGVLPSEYRKSVS